MVGDKIEGEGAWAPSSGYVPNDVGDGSFRERVNDFGERKGKEQNNDTRSRAAAKLSKRLDDICIALENRNKDDLGCNILEVLSMLHNILGIERGSELFMAATKLFLRKENRQMFVALNDLDLQIDLYMTSSSNDSNSDSEYHDDDSEVEEELLDMIVAGVVLTIDHFIKYYVKEPCRTSFYTGWKFVMEILNDHEDRLFEVVLDVISHMAVDFLKPSAP
ncbi:hypothetical protein FEM48_Zijuj12G0164800 [Ziziphus jujuba var. spinosa]|uniref:Uncharacterized protein n=1 Tax=Ziziphus jujuba var. spinosa TaxID=714518 RepID=A0A978UEE6_ZIZJJ|nr:hypothetical protein FEM48_Zijuj12G0164800 [Ziziphus jujuba var. spinosa]